MPYAKVISIMEARNKRMERAKEERGDGDGPVQRVSAKELGMVKVIDKRKKGGGPA